MAPGRKNEYIPIIREIMHSLYEKNKEPTKADYEREVADWLNRGKNKPEYFHRDVHSSVHNAIEKMLDSGELAYYQDKYIIPNTYEDTQLALELYIKKKVKFAKKEIFDVGGKIIGIALKSDKPDDYNSYAEYISEYIGEEQIFSTFLCGDILYIFLLYENPTIVYNLKRIVRETYEKQLEIEAKKKLKLEKREEGQS